MSNINISSPTASEKSRAELEHELQEVLQQLADLKRSTAGQNHPRSASRCDGSIAVTTSQVTTSLSKSTGTSSSYAPVQMAPEVGREVFVSRSNPVGTQASYSLATNCTTQDTISRSSFFAPLEPDGFVRL